MVKLCEKCGKQFTTNRFKARFCSYLCYWNWLIGRKYKIKNNTCIWCGKEFITNKYLQKKFCSIDCYWKSMKGKRFRRKTPHIIKCKNCQKVFEVYPSLKERKFCSYGCFTKHQQGKNHWHWEGGKTSKYDKLKASNEWKEWRRKIFERDNYTCQDCGFKNGKEIKHKDLHPHHKKSASKYPKLIFKLSNGITLCVKCHGKRHSINFKNRRPPI